MKLNDLITINYGKDYKHLEKGTIPVYGTGGIMDHVDSYLSNSHSIGIGRKGTINKPFILNPPFWTVDTLFYCTPKCDNDINYLYYLISNINLLKYNEGTTLPSLSSKTIKNISVSIHPIDKQKQIGNFLSNVDNLIESKREEIKLKEEYKKGIIQKIFNKEIRFKDEDGNYYPEWEDKRLSQVGLIVTGFTPKTSESHLWDGKLNFITPTDIKGKYQYKTERKVSKIDRVNKLIIPKGSIIYTCIASIGKMTITQDECITNQQINSIIPFENFNNEFIYYTLLFNKKKIRSNASSFGMAMINKNDFSKFIFQFPSLQEQNKITDFISLIDIELNTLNKELYKYFQMKKKLLTIIFSFDKGCYE